MVRRVEGEMHRRDGARWQEERRGGQRSFPRSTNLFRAQIASLGLQLQGEGVWKCVAHSRPQCPHEGLLHGPSLRPCHRQTGQQLGGAACHQLGVL